MNNQQSIIRRRGEIAPAPRSLKGEVATTLTLLTLGLMLAGTFFGLRQTSQVQNILGRAQTKDNPLPGNRFTKYSNTCETTFIQTRDPNIYKITIGKRGLPPVFTVEEPTAPLPFYIAHKNHRFVVNWDVRENPGKVRLTVANPSVQTYYYDKPAALNGGEEWLVTAYYWVRSGTTATGFRTTYYYEEMTGKAGCEPPSTLTTSPTPPSGTPTPTTTTACTYYAETFVRECLRQDTTGRCIESRPIAEYDEFIPDLPRKYGAANEKQRDPAKFGDRPMDAHPYSSKNASQRPPDNIAPPGEIIIGSRTAPITTQFIGGIGDNSDRLGYLKTGEYAEVKGYFNASDRTGTPDFGYEIVGQQCTSNTLEDGCGAGGIKTFNIPANAARDPKIVENVKVQCGTDVRYGWYLKKKGVPSSTPSPTPGGACTFRALTYIKNADTGAFITDFDEKGTGNARGLYGHANDKQIVREGPRPMFNHPFASHNTIVDRSLVGQTLIGKYNNMTFPTIDGYNNGDFANITLFLDGNKDGKIDGGWEVVRQECKSNTLADGCGFSPAGASLKQFTRPANQVTDPKVISRIKVACNTDVEYGWFLRKTGRGDDPVVSATPSPTPRGGGNPTSTPKPKKDDTKRAHQMDLGTFIGNSYQNDLCYVARDSEGNENRNRRGDHCRYSSSWDSESKEVTQLVVEYVNAPTNPAKQLRWQLNTCDGKIFSENDQECHGFVAADFYKERDAIVAIPPGKTLRCVWNNPKSNDHVDCSITDGPIGGPGGGAAPTIRPTSPPEGGTTPPAGGQVPSSTPRPQPTTQPSTPACELSFAQGGRNGRCDSQGNSDEKTFGAFGCTQGERCWEKTDISLPVCRSTSQTGGRCAFERSLAQGGTVCRDGSTGGTQYCCAQGQVIRDNKCQDPLPACRDSAPAQCSENPLRGGSRCTDGDTDRYCCPTNQVIENGQCVDVLCYCANTGSCASSCARYGNAGAACQPGEAGNQSCREIIGRQPTSDELIIADIDTNNSINAVDAAVCLAEWGATRDGQDLSLRCDTNGDGTTNSRDVSFVMGYLGYTVE